MITLNIKEVEKLQKEGYKFKYIDMVDCHKSFYRRYKNNYELDIVVVDCEIK